MKNKIEIGNSKEIYFCGDDSPILVNCQCTNKKCDSNPDTYICETCKERWFIPRNKEEEKYTKR